MRTAQAVRGKDVYVGIDVHKENWHVTIRSDGEERFNGRIPGKYQSLKSILHRYRECRVTVATKQAPSGSGSWIGWSRTALKLWSFLLPSSPLSQAIRSKPTRGTAASLPRCWRATC